MTAGYLGTLDEISVSGSVTGGSGSKYYIPITSGAISAVAEDPDKDKSTPDYKENTTAAISSGGYLKIDAGWIPNTKISLATLIGDFSSDDSKVTPTIAATTMLSGYKAYDEQGNVLLGQIPTKTSSNLSASGKTVTVPAGYYASQATKSVADAGTATVQPTAVTTAVTVGTTQSSDGYYTVSNTVGAKAYHASAGWCAASSSSPETGTASIQVGKVAASSTSVTLTNNKAALTLGSTLTIGAGYYPAARTFTIPSASESTGTTAVTAGLSLGNAPTDGSSNTYTNPTLVTSKASGIPYVTINGTASANTGKVVSSVTSPSTKYLEVYTGTYSVS